jgi:hypothetical protein
MNQTTGRHLFIPRVFKFCDFGNGMKTPECFYSAAFILLPMGSDEFTKHDGVGYNNVQAPQETTAGSFGDWGSGVE